MKRNLNKLVFCSILCSILLIGCKKDDDSGPSNSLTYSGTKYELSKGYLENYGETWEDNVYNFDLTLCSSGITVTEDAHTGVGNFFYFEMYSSSATELTPGTYTFSSSDVETPSTFDMGLAGVNYDIANEIGTYLEFVGGTVVIEKTGSIYTITIDCALPSAAKVTGYYKGELIYYDQRGS
jgi:hypothetical protein